MNYLERFKVTPRTRVKLEDIDSSFTDHHASQAQAGPDIALYGARLMELQELLYVDRRYSVLICLQAMDAGGKDGTVKHVVGAMNPQGARVVSFKSPSAEERAHDFLWRIHRSTPSKGELVVFNRSHYEDVLIVRVHDLVPKRVWSRRYDQINAFEQELAEANTHILKFYLHISKEEQLRRLRARFDDPTKHWKIDESDYYERGFWDDYMVAYDEAMSRCSTERAPWFVIPANHKWFRNLAVSRILVEYLEGLDLKFPPAAVNLEQIRQKYHDGSERKEKPRHG